MGQSQSQCRNQPISTLAHVNGCRGTQNGACQNGVAFEHVHGSTGGLSGQWDGEEAARWYVELRIVFVFLIFLHKKARKRIWLLLSMRMGTQENSGVSNLGKKLQNAESRKEGFVTRAEQTEHVVD